MRSSEERFHSITRIAALDIVTRKGDNRNSVTQGLSFVQVGRARTVCFIFFSLFP